ncbi:site-specific DNA-methyltransferase [Paraclostridium sordellii]|uniref:site-specific DNA-methyltransferase n=1 Tax=Paraclostridium sordellii TaxID=1505 RepID=UPI000C756ED3|nr:site-specific DNA-methyltransferase [Paeniclostridium sordellii]AUN14318.1 site-specific DNA-methyltransferase [Paeniclostridium sordellii]
MNPDKLKYIEKYSYGEVSSENLIIKGDNYEVLGLLKEKFDSKVKCIYIDPPYNNGEKYTHYNDQVHEEWLDDIKCRLEKMKPLLSDDGSIWISIDDNEVHYLKVAADQIFGRKNFITTIIWQQRTSRENRKIFSNNHEYILVYAKNPDLFKKSRNLLPPTEEMINRYKNLDNDPRGPWQSVSLNVQDGHASKNQFYEIKAPNGKVHIPPKGRCWSYNKERMEKEIEMNNIWFGSDGNGVPRRKKFLDLNTLGATPETIWLGADVGTNKIAKKNLIKLFPDNHIFDTPKPEELIKRIFDIATNEGDLILDAYLGSGTTTAVAQKMNRRFIGIEQGEHIVDYVVERMKKVIDGEDGGISKEVGWKGGGSFKYYELISDENKILYINEKKCIQK